MTPNPRLLSSLLLAILLVSCASIDVHHEDRLPRLQIQTGWQIQLHELPLLSYFPIESAAPAYGARGRIVVAGSEGGEVIAARANSGDELWRFRVAGKVRGAPAIRDSDVFVGSTDGRLYKLDLVTGAELWDQPYTTKGAITSAPVIDGKRVLFQTNRNRVYALDADTGLYLWDQGRPRPDFLTVKGEGGPTVVDEVVFAGYEDGFLVAMRVEDGATIWSKNLAADERQFIDIDSRPIIWRDTVIVSCFNVGLYALDRTHGNIRWLFPARGVQTPALGDRHLFITTGAGEIVALDPQTGKPVWKAQISYGNLGSPTVRGERLLVPTGDGLLLMDADRGTVKARISPDDGQSARVVTNGSWIHMVTNSGALVGARLL